MQKRRARGGWAASGVLCAFACRVLQRDSGDSSRQASRLRTRSSVAIRPRQDLFLVTLRALHFLPASTGLVRRPRRHPVLACHIHV